MRNAPGPEVTRKLEQALLQWRHWDCQPPLPQAPGIDRLLSGGLSNHAYLTTGDTPFVIRIDGETPGRHGLNRALEYRVLKDAAAAGIAPRPIYHNPDLGCLVCCYLAPGTTAASSGAQLDAIGDLLRSIHRLPPRHARLDMQARIDAYLRQASSRNDATTTELIALRPAVQGLLDWAQRDAADLVLCHNDLLADNRLWHAGRLYALDWEYCAMAPRLYDVAVTIEGDELTAPEADRLLNAYLGRSPTASDALAVARYRGLYGYLERLWYCVTATPTERSDKEQDKLATLVEAVRNLSPG